MNEGFRRLVVLILLMMFTVVETAMAVTLPTASIGIPFSGSFSLNPNTPLSSFTTSTDFIYTNPIGLFTVTINGGTFAAPIDFVDAVPGSDDTWRWYLSANQQPTLNGVAIPLSVMNIILYGSTNSTSILPLPLSSYSTNDPSSFYTGPNFQMVASDGTLVANYAGPLSYLIQLDNAGNFIFGGTIADTTALPSAVPGPIVGAGVPGLVLAVLGFIGWRRSRRTISA